MQEKLNHLNLFSPFLIAHEQIQLFFCYLSSSIVIAISCFCSDLI